MNVSLETSLTSLAWETRWGRSWGAPGNRPVRETSLTGLALETGWGGQGETSPRRFLGSLKKVTEVQSFKSSSFTEKPTARVDQPCGW